MKHKVIIAVLVAQMMVAFSSVNSVMAADENSVDIQLSHATEDLYQQNEYDTIEFGKQYDINNYTYYNIVIPEDGYIDMDYEVSNTLGVSQIYLYDKDGNTINYTNYYEHYTGKINRKTGLAAGNYKLWVGANKMGEIAHLKTNFIPGNNYEKEINNSLERAQSAEFDKKYIGFNNDEDVYYMNLKANQTIRVDVGYLDNNYQMSYAFRLFGPDRDAIGDGDYYYEKETESYYTLVKTNEAGKYYFRIRPNDLQSGQGYTVKFTNVIKPKNNPNATGLLQGTDDKWYYFVNGKIDTTRNDVMKNQYGWWYVQNGKVDFTANTVAKNDKGWWYIKNGKVDFNANGLGKNSKGVWYCKNGRVDFNAAGVLKSATDGYNGWYYVKGGALQTGEETVQSNSSGWWYVGTDGKVDFSANTVARNSYGWWYIKNGKVDFNANGIGRNSKGVWYCKNGMVDFNATGVLQSKTDGYNGWYYIKGGALQTGAETVQKNSNGWWYVGADGKVDFGHEGVASNDYGTWYAKNGKVSFKDTLTYTDKATGAKYKVVNSKATKIN